MTEEKCSCGGNCGCNKEDNNCECECEEGCECSEEIEEIEFGLSLNEIDEWINELSRLKEEKESVILEIDEDLVLKINYAEDEEEMEEEE